MASLTIKNLDNNLKAQLRLRAARHGRSMAAEAKLILANALGAPACEQNLAVAIHSRFESVRVDRYPTPPVKWFAMRQSSMNLPMAAISAKCAGLNRGI